MCEVIYDVCQLARWWIQLKIKAELAIKVQRMLKLVC